MKFILAPFFSFILQAFLLGSSFFLVAFSQPDWSAINCILTSALGYALFWKGMILSPIRRQRFGIALVWFAGVQSIHLSWFAADKYVGGYIYVFLILVSIFFGLFFGLLSFFVQEPKELKIWRILAISGGWTLFEWGRLFLLSGFSWDPMGLVLTKTLAGMQLVSAFGMFGLTFWVLFTNLLAFKFFQFPLRFSYGSLWIAVASVPYLYGLGELSFHRKQMKEMNSEQIAVLLVQTALYPEQKVLFETSNSNSKVYTPLEQWKHILNLLKTHQGKQLDLIAFSEAVVPYGTDMPLYTVEQVLGAFEEILGVQLFSDAGLKASVGNSYWAQTIANYFHADVVIGLEDAEMESKESSLHVYNAAFLFRPDNLGRERYEKRVLVPLGEYIPFSWCKSFLSKYGIEDSFTAGKQAKVFQAKKVPIGISICYEETYGHLMRENRLKGAGLLVNLTNDAWYPHSRLPLVHYLHGRIRAIENGIPVVRASNTGVTCAIDSLGRTLGLLEYEDEKNSPRSDTLYLLLPTYHYPTLYSQYGDQLIICFSIMTIILGLGAAFFPQPAPSFERIDFQH